jgi:hypothetical protein
MLFLLDSALIPSNLRVVSGVYPTFHIPAEDTWPDFPKLHKGTLSFTEKTIFLLFLKPLSTAFVQLVRLMLKITARLPQPLPAPGPQTNTTGFRVLLQQ